MIDRLVENQKSKARYAKDQGQAETLGTHYTRGTTVSSEALHVPQPVTHYSNPSTSLQMPLWKALRGTVPQTLPSQHMGDTGRCTVQWLCLPVPWVSLTLPQSPGFKETAFLYAISSAGLTHALAKACSAGRMERCTCDEAPDLENREAWQWGGCGDNLKYSSKFVKEFLGRRSSKDLRARVDFHNNLVGVKASWVGHRADEGMAVSKTCIGQLRQAGCREAGVRANGGRTVCGGLGGSRSCLS